MKSMRARLLLLLTGGTLAVLLVSYVLVYFLVSRSLAREFDAGVKRRVESLSHMAEWWDGEVDDEEVYEDGGDDPENLVRFEFAELELPEFEESENADYYQVWDEDGRVYARSPSLEGENLAAAPTRSEAPTIERLSLPDGRPGRLAFISFVPEAESDEMPDPPETTFHLAFARSTQGLIDTLRVLRVWLIFSGAVSLVAAAQIIRLVVNRGLRPLVDIGDEIRTIGDKDLAHRIDPAGRPAELVPVCECLNEMLNRLDEAFDRERRFNADVAHELRTPLAELRTLAEVCGRREGLTEADRRSYRDVGDICTRMERLVSALLELSRCSSGQMSKDIRQVALSPLVEAAWKPYAASAAERDLRVHVAVDPSLTLRTDPTILGTILSNLLSNAAAYTPRGGRIHLDCSRRDGAVALAVSNTTNGLKPQDLSRLFEKFWRKDGPGNGTDAHLGLGLTLAAALARVLGVELTCGMPSANEFRIILTHPA